MEFGSIKVGSAMEDALDSEVAPDSELLVAPDSISSEVVLPPDSEEKSLLLYSATSETASVLPDFVPDSVEVVQCFRCVPR